MHRGAYSVDMSPELSTPVDDTPTRYPHLWTTRPLDVVVSPVSVPRDKIFSSPPNGGLTLARGLNTAAPQVGLAGLYGVGFPLGRNSNPRRWRSRSKAAPFKGKPKWLHPTSQVLRLRSVGSIARSVRVVASSALTKSLRFRGSRFLRPRPPARAGSRSIRPSTSTNC